MKERLYLNYAERWKLRFEREHYRRRQHRKNVVLLTAVLGIVMLFASPWIWQLKLEYDLKKIEEKIVSYNQVALILEDIDRLQTNIAKMENFLKTAEQNSKNPRVVLEQITELLPEGTEIKSFSLQADNSVQLGLVLAGPAEVASLWMNLRDSGLFESFDIKTVSLVDKTQSIDLTLKMK